jgi:PAS domain S-box-containing protein
MGSETMRRTIFTSVAGFLLSSSIGGAQALAQASDNTLQPAHGRLGILAAGLAFVFLLGLAVRNTKRRHEEHDSRNWLEATLASIGDAVITTDVHGAVTFLNPVAERLTGWTLDQAQGRSVEEVFRILNQETREPVANPVARVLAHGHTVGLANHTVLIARDGAERPIDDSGAPIRNRRGHVEGVVVVFRDVTERYRAQLALEASERRYRMLFEDNPQPMWIFDEQTLAFLDVNAAAIAHYGYSREEFLSMTIRDIRPPEDVTDLLNDIATHQLTRHTDGPWRHRKKDGTIIAVEITAMAIDGSGRPAKFIAITDVTARIQAEAAVHRSEEQYRVIVETISDAIVTIDEESKILFASPPVERIFGYEPHELVGRPVTDLMPESLRPAHLAGFGRYLKKNQRHTSWHLLELPGLHKDGSEISLELSFGEFRDGTRRWFTGVIRDVSERRRQQESLRQARELIQTVFNTVPLAIWGIDLMGRVTFWNRAAESMFGWREAEVLGGELPVIPGEQRAEYQQWLSRYATGFQHAALERQRLRKDGSLLECAIWTTPLRSATGAISGTVGILADIAERKRYERTVSESEQKFRKLFADNPQPMWVFDVETLRFLEVNEAAMKLYGYTREEFLSMSAIEIRPPEDVPAFLETLHGRSDLQNAGEWKHVLKDGRIITVHIAAHRMDLFGTHAVLSLLQDVSDRKRAEDEVKKYVRYLANSNHDLEQFAWAASHELQEPIRMVTIHTQLFERRFGHSVSPEGKQLLEFAREGAARMHSLVEALRAYWNLQHKTLKLGGVSLNSALQSAIAALQPTLEAAKATVTWDNLPAITADPELIAELFFHLLDNAVKFRSEAPPQIHVSARQSGADWVIDVQDNGIGLEPEYAERVFRLFQRLSRNYPGVGMGLSLCKQIMERHDGRISLQSEAGRGTTVHLEFPRWPAAKG